MFLFNFRKCLQDIRSLPICGFTEWVYGEEQSTCMTRIALFHVTIDDLCLLQQPFIENVEEVIARFERTYLHLREKLPFLFHDHEFYDLFL